MDPSASRMNSTIYPQPSFEPDHQFKAQLQQRIEENLQQLLRDAQETYNRKMASLPPTSTQPPPPPSSSSSSSLLNATQNSIPGNNNNAMPETEEAALRRKIYLDHLQTIHNLKSFARDEYNHAIERERQEMQWVVAAAQEQSQGCEEGMYYDEESQQFYSRDLRHHHHHHPHHHPEEVHREDRHRRETQAEERRAVEEPFTVDESLKEEQFEMLEAFHRAQATVPPVQRGFDARGYAPSGEFDGRGYVEYTYDGSESSVLNEEDDDDFEHVAANRSGSSSAYFRASHLSEIEEESEQSEEDVGSSAEEEEEERNEYGEEGPGTPLVHAMNSLHLNADAPLAHPKPLNEVLDAQLKAHAEELSRLLSATPSPPRSPFLPLSYSTSMPSSSMTSPSIPPASLLMSPSPWSGSPSPPDTPPSLSASASDCEPSSAEGSIIFARTPKHSGLSLDQDQQDPAMMIQRSHSELSSTSTSSIQTNPDSYALDALLLAKFQEKTNGLIFTPSPSVIHEELRLRAERHAEQQQEFARRAEEIRRRKVEQQEAFARKAEEIRAKKMKSKQAVKLLRDKKDEEEEKDKDKEEEEFVKVVAFVESATSSAQSTPPQTPHRTPNRALVVSPPPPPPPPKPAPSAPSKSIGAYALVRSRSTPPVKTPQTPYNTPVRGRAPQQGVKPARPPPKPTAFVHPATFSREWSDIMRDEWADGLW